MFGTILLTATALMVGYIFWRMGDTLLLDRLSWPIRLGLGVLSWVFVWFGRVFGHGHDGQWAPIIELAGMNLLVIIFLTFVTLLFVDIITGFGFFLPRIAPKLRGAAVLAGLLLSGLAMVQGLRAPVITEYEVALPGLPGDLDGMVIAGLSDLHIGSQLDTDWLKARIEQTMAMQPDMIVLLGDIFEGHSLDSDALLPVLRTLRAPLGVFAVQGNHEQYGREGNPMQLMADAGFNVLLNQWQSPASGLTMAGVEDLTIHSHMAAPTDPITETLTKRPTGATILLSHTPLRTAEAGAKDVGLMLSGHTHAGQVWPFGYLVRLRYPLLEGRHEVDSMTVIVCRGTGMWGPRMRLWEPSEILRITLRSKNDHQSD